MEQNKCGIKLEHIMIAVSSQSWLMVIENSLGIQVVIQPCPGCVPSLSQNKMGMGT